MPSANRKPSNHVIATSKRGTPITEELAEQLANEAERGYDLAKAPRGRPSLTAPGAHSPRVTIRLPAAVHAELQAAADERQTSVSQIVRQLVEREAPSLRRRRRRQTKRSQRPRQDSNLGPSD